MSGGRGRDPGSTRIEAAIRRYRQHHRWKAVDELGSFADEASVHSAIERAGLARRPDGKRYDHQRRLPGSVLSGVRARLLEADLDRCGSFHELHKRVRELIES